MSQLVYQVFYTRYQVWIYLWPIRLVLNHYTGVQTIAPRKFPDNCPLDNCPLDNCPPDCCPSDNCLRGQLPPKKIVPWIIAPRAITPEENCPLGILPPRVIAPWMTVPGLLPPDNYHKDNCPLTIYPWKLPPRKTAFWIICRLHNCPLVKCPRGKLSSRKIVLRINYTRDIFSPRIRSCSTLTDSCFLLFSFFVV